MIKILLSRKLGELRWTQADLSRVTGIRPTTINELYHEFAEHVNLDNAIMRLRCLNWASEWRWIIPLFLRDSYPFYLEGLNQAYTVDKPRYFSAGGRPLFMNRDLHIQNRV